jgi:hypothetical protein
MSAASGVVFRSANGNAVGGEDDFRAWRVFHLRVIWHIHVLWEWRMYVVSQAQRSTMRSF